MLTDVELEMVALQLERDEALEMVDEYLEVLKATQERFREYKEVVSRQREHDEALERTQLEQVKRERDEALERFQRAQARQLDFLEQAERERDEQRRAAEDFRNWTGSR